MFVKNASQWTKSRKSLGTSFEYIYIYIYIYIFVLYNMGIREHIAYPVCPEQIV